MLRPQELDFLGNLIEVSVNLRDQWVTHFGENFTIFNTKVLKIEEFRNHDLLMISKGLGDFGFRVISKSNPKMVDFY